MKKTIILFLSLLLLISFSACSFSATTANFKDLQVASEVDEDTYTPVTVTTNFNMDSPIIYVTGSANNAPEGTVIKAEWLYTEQDPEISIDSTTIELTEVDTDFYFSLSRPDNGWPSGNYETKLYIDDEYEESVTFQVE